MPSGRVHDRITLWSLPLVVGLTFGQTRSGSLTLLLAGGFLVGGLMFGPDLDIYSRQYQRWGVFRWLWLPYRKMMRHRSFWSHGFLVGTTLRLVYLGGWLTLLVLLSVFLAQHLWDVYVDWESLWNWGVRSLQSHTVEGLTLYLGLELGAMSHSLSDWGNSAYKRWKQQGWQGLRSARRPKQRKRRVPGRPGARVSPGDRIQLPNYSSKSSSSKSSSSSSSKSSS
jgi:uncharacterized metal-binding protein